MIYEMTHHGEGTSGYKLTTEDFKYIQRKLIAKMRAEKDDSPDAMDVLIELIKNNRRVLAICYFLLQNKTLISKFAPSRQALYHRLVNEQSDVIYSTLMGYRDGYGYPSASDSSEGGTRRRR